jgi:peptidoglycan hydrolase CwlO-like protein
VKWLTKICAEWREVKHLIGALHLRLEQIEQIERKIMAQLDDLITQVKANEDVEASAVALINGLAEKLQSAGTDTAKLQALQTEMKGSADKLAAAVAANTPATTPAPTPAATPVPAVAPATPTPAAATPSPTPATPPAS